MTKNIMEQYIQLTKLQINTYMKLVFEKQYNKNYIDLFTDRYINIRYYNFYENDFSKNMRTKILNHLKEVKEEIIINHIDDRVLLEQINLFYVYVLYFDKVVMYKNLKGIISKITNMREKVLNKQDPEFEKTLYDKVSEYTKQKEELIENLESEEFRLKLTNYQDKVNVYRVNLKYDLKFPLVYSKFAIEKAFNTGIISEDKLEIEYYLIVNQIIKDILKANFKKQYVLEFASTLLSKTKKMKHILNIIDNDAIKEKISLKIRYEDFEENKEIIYELMRQGIRFSVIVDNSFDLNYINIESLKMFKFIIVNKNHKNYYEIEENNLIKNKVIIT